MFSADNKHKKFGGGALLISFAFLAAFVFITKDYIHMLMEGYKTEGRVYKLVERGEERYAPMVEFTTWDGNIVTFTDNVISGRSKYKIDELVTVYYLPKNTNKAIVYNIFHISLFSLIPLVMSIVMFMLSLQAFRAKPWDFGQKSDYFIAYG